MNVMEQRRHNEAIENQAKIESLEAQLAEKDAEIERLEQQQRDFQVNALEIFCCACDNHSGARTPTFYEFQNTLKGRCHWCDVLENERLKNALAHSESWKGLMEILDKHYPSDVFVSSYDNLEADTLTRLVNAIRVIDERKSEVFRLQLNQETASNNARFYADLTVKLEAENERLRKLPDEILAEIETQGKSFLGRGLELGQSLYNVMPFIQEIFAKFTQSASDSVDDDKCLCVTECDCEDESNGLVSEECPIHNLQPYPNEECPVHGGD